MDLLDEIMAWENGEYLDGSAEEVDLFQRLINSGTIHSLQGSYQRRANDLMAQGLVE